MRTELRIWKSTCLCSSDGGAVLGVGLHDLFAKHGPNVAVDLREGGRGADVGHAAGTLERDREVRNRVRGRTSRENEHAVGHRDGRVHLRSIGFYDFRP